MPKIFIHNDRVTFDVHVVPGSGRETIVGQHGDALKIKIKAPPADGKANKSLIAFLAGKLDISRACIQIISGLTNRHKRISAQGVSKEQILNLFRTSE